MSNSPVPKRRAASFKWVLGYWLVMMYQNICIYKSFRSKVHAYQTLWRESISLDFICVYLYVTLQLSDWYPQTPKIHITVNNSPNLSGPWFSVNFLRHIDMYGGAVYRKWLTAPKRVSQTRLPGPPLSENKPRLPIKPVLHRRLVSTRWKSSMGR